MQLFSEFINQIPQILIDQSHRKTGVYASKYDWAPIMGNYTGGSDHQLWSVIYSVCMVSIFKNHACVAGMPIMITGLHLTTSLHLEVGLALQSSSMLEMRLYVVGIIKVEGVLCNLLDSLLLQGLMLTRIGISAIHVSDSAKTNVVVCSYTFVFANSLNQPL